MNDKSSNKQSKNRVTKPKTVEMPNELACRYEQLLDTQDSPNEPKCSIPDLSNKLEEKYEVGERIARGGMGDVHRVIDANCQRSVAMKVIHGADRKSPKRIFRFIREARITAQLEHPNIVPIYELSIDADGNVFYTMKRVKGTTLEEILSGLKKKNPRMVANYPLRQLLTIFQGICNAMAYAHSKMVIHRDLKPNNIMLGKYGEVLVMDWGLAKVSDKTTPLDTELVDTDLKVKKRFANSVSKGPIPDGYTTKVGEMLGTPGYMSPEAAEGKVTEMDRRSDIFSLGVILYKILTLREPTTGLSPSDLIKLLKNGEIPSPDAFHKTLRKNKELFLKDLELPHHCPSQKVPSSLSAVAMKAMAINPDDRYQTVRELQKEISRYQSGYATSAEDAGLLKLMNLLIRRHRVFSLGLLVIILLTASFVIQIMQSERRAKDAAREAEEQQIIAEKNKVRAEEAGYRARLQYARGLISQGNSFKSLNQWANAQSAYQKAYRLFKELNQPTFVAEFKLWETMRNLPPVVTKCLGGKGQPLRMEMSKDGRRCISGYYDGTLVLWDLIKFLPISTYSDTENSTLISAVDLANSAPLFLVGRFDGSISLWNLETNQKLLSFEGHHQMVNKVLFFPDESKALSASEDGSMILWNLETGQKMSTLSGHVGSVENMAISHDEQWVVSGGSDNALILWDQHRGEKLKIIAGHEHEIRTVLFSPDDHRIISGDYNGIVRIWDRASGNQLHEFKDHKSPIVEAMLTADGRYLITGQEDSTISLWDLISDIPDRKFKCHFGDLVNLKFSPAGICLSAGVEGDSLSIQPLAQREINTFTGHEGPIECVCLSTDGRLAVSTGRDKRIIIWDMATGKPLREITAHNSMATYVAFLPNQYKVLSGGHDGVLKLWEISSGKEVFSLKGNYGPITGLAISPDGKLALVGYQDGHVLSCNLETGEIKTTIDILNNKVISLAISNDGRLTLIGSADGNLSLRNLVTNGALNEFAIRGLQKAIFSPDSKLILCTLNDGSMRLMKVNSGDQKLKFHSQGDDIQDVDFTPDGLYMITASRDASIKLWDVESGRVFATLTDHAKEVTSIRFSPDGKKILSGSKDKTLKLWDISRYLRSLEFNHKIRFARQVLSKNPHDPNSLAILGEWYAFRGLWEWALELLHEARKNGGETSALTLARCYWEIGRLDKAKEEFNHALKKNAVSKPYLELCINAVSAANETKPKFR